MLCAALLALLFTFDALRSGGSDFRVSPTDRLPRRYLRPRPLKSAAETLLRLFPHPEPVGLYRIGSAGIDSPVLVTGNFDLTVRRVCSAVKNFDCWLLVCDSRGVNVWCASMAGHFITDSVVRAIGRTNLDGRVRSRRLILPQLCASSVSLETLENRTGFSASFGPLYINDIGAYRNNPCDPAVREARFPLKARLEMALGCPLLLAIPVVLVYNFIGLGHLLVLLPLLYLASLIHGLAFPRCPLKRIGPWVLVYLVPYRKPRVEVDGQSCIGCRRCVEVCPRAVFQMEGKLSVVVGEKRCVICRSCFSQCPTGAVHHSHAPA